MKTHHFARALSALCLALTLTNCQSPAEPDLGQVLRAEGEVYALDGVTRLPELPIDDYSIYFRVTDTVEILKRITQAVPNSTPATPIQTGLDGIFQLTAHNLGLHYSYLTDPYLACQDVCVDYDTQCYTYTEDVCTEHCWTEEYEDCSPVCDDVCTEDCRDVRHCENYTDKDGNPYQECWTEQECSRDCHQECYNECRTRSRRQCETECVPEEREQCDRVCVETTEECWWQQDTVNVYPRFEDVQATRTELALTDADGLSHIVVGEPLQSRQAQECTTAPETGVETCENINEWLQTDRFITRFGAPASSEPIDSAIPDHRVRQTKAARARHRTTNDQQDQLTATQMESLRELRRILGIRPDQVRGRQ